MLLALVLTACGRAEKESNNKTVKEETENNIEQVEKEEAETEKEVETTEETPENSTQIPEITQSGSTQPTVTKTTMYAKSSVNVRSGAGTSHSKVGSLAKGQEVTKVGEENGWSKIEFNGTMGYVNSNYLSTEKVEVGNTVNNSNTTKPNNGSSNNTVNNTTPNQNTETPVHEHSWEAVKEEKTVYFAWRTLCGKCGLDMTDLSDDDLTLHTAVICRSRYSTKYIEVDFVTENTSTRVTIVGYKCSCGATKEGSGESWIEAR